jgi:hypothetical protein
MGHRHENQVASTSRWPTPAGRQVANCIRVGAVVIESNGISGKNSGAIGRVPIIRKAQQWTQSGIHSRRPVAPVVVVMTAEFKAAGGERYVITEELAAAIVGRETDLLDRLGIPWRSGAPHILCPYEPGGHADREPSWRWDPEKQRAFCSCIERRHPKGYKTHRIIDVVCLVRGLTFSDAKLWCAEALHLGHLIKTKGKLRPIDAAGLLDPPQDQRDDGIVRNYLAFRLDIAATDVVMPSTPVAGWRMLGYYDPPVGDGRSVKVGDYCCAVFGMSDTDCRIHAHRIYVMPGGQGKAELPLTSDGRKRDPKKLAPLAPGDRVDGRSVIWGDLSGAGWMILCEGIETACAVAYAFQSELALRSLAIAATISTSGMTSFRPGPNCQQIIVAADRDEEERDGRPASRAGERAARDFCTAHFDKLKVGVGYVLPGAPGTNTDWLDLMRAEGVDAVRNALLSPSKFEPAPEDVERRSSAEIAENNKLIMGDDGCPKPVLHNAIVVLRRQLGPDLGFDTFAQRVIYTGRAPWQGTTAATECDDYFDLKATDWLHQQMVLVRPVVTHEALLALAHDRPFHPVRDYLGGLVWDGEERIDTWAITYLGAADTPYIKAVSARFLIGLVARVQQPGCKFDCVLILEGPQGSLKSTALRTLVGDEWFSDEIGDLGDKDTALQIQGIWLTELAELDSLLRAGHTRAKAFFSRPKDRFRPPYGRVAVDHPRQCGFAGSTNEDQYLRDPTGGRRFWSVACGTIDIDGLKAAKDQLWAEADARFKAGARYWIGADEPELIKDAAQEVAAREVADTWDEQIEEYILKRKEVTVRDLLRDALYIMIDKQTRRDQKRVVDSLTRLGWRLDGQIRTADGKRPKVYRPKDR